jgi:citrate synthase
VTRRLSEAARPDRDGNSSLVASRAKVVLDLVRIVSRETGAQPSVDLGVVAVTRTLGAEVGMATALFGLGRAAGWVAHYLEQRRDGAIVRPRARYVGPE